MVGSGALSNTAAKAVYQRMVVDASSPAEVAERLGLTQVGDDATIDAWVTEVLAEHPAEAARFLSGEARLQGVLVGLVMKKSKGRADPRKVSQAVAARGAAGK
jgi:aspartyl-tRNA(Asn)/glutamyl-tRNA(Gln) amidotransferase subunit B